MGEEPIRDEVRRRYAAVAVSVREGGGSSCCGSDVGRVIDSEARGVDWMGGAILRSKSASCRGPLWRLRLGAVTRSPLRRSPRARWFWTWAVKYGAELAASGCCGGLDLERALSDPIRVRMLGMLAAEAAEGRGCCGLPDLGAPVSGEEDSPGICVCELEECFEMGQSRVSYHMRKLKEAGLVREQRRGRWSFYSLDREAARDLLADTGKHLSV
jgi:ArsR family transcriptional regulator